MATKITVKSIRKPVSKSSSISKKVKKEVKVVKKAVKKEVKVVKKAVKKDVKAVKQVVKKEVTAVKNAIAPKKKTVASVKATVKKKSIEKIVKKTEVQKFLFSVDENLSFYLSDGRRLYNLRDLENALQGMNVALFSQHVNEERNDFANWIQDVFGYQELASQMKKVKTVKGALQKVKDGLVN